MLGSSLPRKMLVTIGTLKNVDYLDRISNRMSLFPYPFSHCPFSYPFSFFIVALSPPVSSSRRWCGKRILLSERHLVRRNIHLATAAVLVAHSERMPSGLHKVERFVISKSASIRGVWNERTRKAGDPSRIQWTDKGFRILIIQDLSCV